MSDSVNYITFDHSVTKRHHFAVDVTASKMQIGSNEIDAVKILNLKTEVYSPGGVETVCYHDEKDGTSLVIPINMIPQLIDRLQVVLSESEGHLVVNNTKE